MIKMAKKKLNGVRGRKRKRVRKITLASRENPAPGRPRTRDLPPGIALAVEAVGGTTKALAELVGVSPQAVSAWDVIPANRVRRIEKITGVPREKLRPDLFG
jgi:hypothetical protein